MTWIEIVRALDLCSVSSFADANGECKGCPYKCDFEHVRDYTMVPRRLMRDALYALVEMRREMDAENDGEHEAD